MSREIFGIEQRLGTVIPFPRSRDAQARRAHREGIAAERRSALFTILSLFAIALILGAVSAYGFGYLQGKAP